MKSLQALEAQNHPRMIYGHKNKFVRPKRTDETKKFVTNLESHDFYFSGPFLGSECVIFLYGDDTHCLESHLKNDIKAI